MTAETQTKPEFESTAVPVQDRSPGDSGYGTPTGEKEAHGRDATTSSTPGAESPSPTQDLEPAVEKAAPPPGPAFNDEAAKNYRPKTLKFWLIIMSAMISMFVVALDRTIISTAIPQITNDFGSLGDIGWYGSSYMITTAAFQLLYGRLYRFYDLRWTFLVTIVVFEMGSLICALAPSSPVFILGRSIAGLGSAGIMTGSMLIIIPMVPLHKRPMFQSIFGMIFGISAVTGPLIGGAFTADKLLTWRWCFWMNLPVGAAAFVCLFFFLQSPAKPKTPSATIKQHVMRLDPLGTFFFVPCMVCLVLALQWGGSEYAWSSWRLIVLFVAFGLAAIAFSAVQVLMPQSASLPVRVITQRTMLSGVFFMIFLSGAMFLSVYYLPLWFQTTHGVDPVKSGIYTLPLVASLAVAGLLSGIFTQKIGYYVPSMLICPILMAIGEGLLSTMTVDSGSAQWIGFQFLTGFGNGFGMQTVGLAVQATLPREDIPTGMAITFWSQQLGGAIFVSVGQTILNAVLSDRLAHIEGLDPKAIINAGATDLHAMVADEDFGAVKDAYNHACTRIFLAAVALSAAQLVCAGFQQWRSIKKPKGGPPQAKGPGAAANAPVKA